MQKTIIYNGSEVVVSKEVAEFLEQERKRENAEQRSDRRHKDFTDLETAELLNAHTALSDPILNDVIWEETLEQLRNYSDLPCFKCPYIREDFSEHRSRRHFYLMPSERTLNTFRKGGSI